MQKHYWANRAHDATDFVQVHVFFGQALGAQVEATRFLFLGWSTERNVRAAGYVDRHFAKWEETVDTWGLIVGRHDEEHVKGIPRVTGTYGWNIGDGGSLYTSSGSKAMFDWFAVRATVAVGLGLDLELRLGEVVDFIGGLFNWDPSHDDEL